MIRGVNKNIIEISNTGNDCFERAILFVRPERMQNDNKHMEQWAADYLSGMKLRPWFRPRGRLVFRIIGWLVAAGVGAALTTLLFLL